MRTAADPSDPPKRSPTRTPWSDDCRWDSSLNCRNPAQLPRRRSRAVRRCRIAPATGIGRLRTTSGQQAGGKQPTLTTSVFSGRSRRTTRRRQRRSERSALLGLGEHFGRGDHFANLRPICSHLQGQDTQRLLTGMTCAYSPATEDRERSTAAQNRGALRVKQDAAPILTCGNAKPQAGVGAVACRWVPFEVVECRSVHPVAPNPLPRCRARHRAAAVEPGRPGPAGCRQPIVAAGRSALGAMADARSATDKLRCSRCAPATRVSSGPTHKCHAVSAADPDIGSWLGRASWRARVM